MKLYLLRHGQTDYNVRGLCNDDPARAVQLNSAGIRQAMAAAERLKSTTISRILVSELPRTQHTAAIVNRYHGAEITVEPDINDLRTGFDGRPATEHHRAIARDPLNARPPGGESLIEHKQRVLGFIERLRRRPEQAVLVVAHEETLRVCVAYFRGLSDDEMLSLEVDNCQLFTFDLSEPAP